MSYLVFLIIIIIDNLLFQGYGDTKIADISYLPDPCPLPDKLKKRTLLDKERLIYAPFSGVGGVVYDKDAVYIELGGSHSHKHVSIFICCVIVFYNVRYVSVVKKVG